MTRRGTVIRHEILTSETIATMNDLQRVVFQGLIYCADDWGRIEDNPVKLSMRMVAFGKSPGDIRAVIEWLLEQEDSPIIRYTIRLSGDVSGDNRMITVLQLVNWEKHQSFLKSRSAAELPDQKGEYEPTTNPFARAKLKSGDASGDASDDYKGKGKGKGKEEGKEKPKKREGDKSPPSLKFLEAARQIFPEASEKNIVLQAQALEEIQRLDRFIDTNEPITLEELLPALIWARQDLFWGRNFKSCCGLRKRKDGAATPTKWEKIYAQWEGKQGSGFDFRDQGG